MGRFVCKKCEGTIQRDETYNSEKRIRYVCCSFFLTVCLLTATTATIFGANGFYKETKKTYEGMNLLIETNPSDGGRLSMQEDVSLIIKTADNLNMMLAPPPTEYQ